jgi:hypothetical protein
MARDSNAQPGQSFLTPFGEWRTLVSATSAGLWIEAQVEQQIKQFKGTPSFTRDSITGRCAMYGERSGRDKRNIERARLRNNKPVRKLTNEEHP